jgi:hypothetical protein
MSSGNPTAERGCFGLLSGGGTDKDGELTRQFSEATSAALVVHGMRG